MCAKSMAKDLKKEHTNYLMTTGIQIYLLYNSTSTSL